MACGARCARGVAGYGSSGFKVTMRGGPDTGTSTATDRFFMGLKPAANPTDVNPSTLANIVGMGWDSADTNVQIMTNDASGTATKIDLGASFLVGQQGLGAHLSQIEFEYTEADAELVRQAVFGDGEEK